MSFTARGPSYCAGRLRRRSSRRPGNGVGSTVPYTVTMHPRCKVCLYRSQFGRDSPVHDRAILDKGQVASVHPSKAPALSAMIKFPCLLLPPSESRLSSLRFPGIMLASSLLLPYGGLLHEGASTGRLELRRLDSTGQIHFARMSTEMVIPRQGCRLHFVSRLLPSRPP